MTENKELIPISILTGFLGAGKTTILKQLLSSPELADTAVLINEFGEIGLDHLLVNTISEEIVLLESGCVCCSVRDDFSQALLTLYANREKQSIPAFQRVILETTGIADPVALHQLIMSDQEITKYYRYHDTITIVDGVYAQQTLDKHFEALKQISIADHLVIAKTDLADAASVDELESRVHDLNPRATIIRSSHDKMALGPLCQRYGKTTDTASRTWRDNDEHVVKTDVSDEHPTRHDQRFSTYCLSWPEAVAWDDFLAWLEGLLIARGDSIHRLKGLVHIIDEPCPLVIQGVQHTFYPATKLDKWPVAKPMTELVFITSDFSRQAAIVSLADILEVTVS